MVPISEIERLLRERNETDFRVLRINRSKEDEYRLFIVSAAHMSRNIRFLIQRITNKSRIPDRE